MRAEIAATGAGRDVAVSLDGVPVDELISGLTLTITPHRPPRLDLRVIVTRRTAAILEDCRVGVEPAVAALLQRLGWKPPAGEDEADQGDAPA